MHGGSSGPIAVLGLAMTFGGGSRGGIPVPGQRLCRVLFWLFDTEVSNLPSEVIVDLPMPGTADVCSGQDCATTSAALPLGAARNHTIRDDESGRDASYRYFELLKVFAGGIDCVRAVQLEGLPKRYLQRFKQFVSGRLLAIDTRNFLDPPDPPIAVLFHDCCVAAGFHSEYPGQYSTDQAPAYGERYAVLEMALLTFRWVGTAGLLWICGQSAAPIPA